MVLLNEYIKKSCGPIYHRLYGYQQQRRLGHGYSDHEIDVVTIQGYDPVAYFTENRATQCKSTNSYTWNEASWHFTTPEHHDLSSAASEKYAPKYGASERSD